jgi:8-oxo-dGTP diphosphatase
MKKQMYVVGFLFNQDRNKVALIKKLKPQWQRGLLNGVGGKIEAGETSKEAMIREFREETGVDTSDLDIWDKYAVIEFPKATLNVFRAFSDRVYDVKTVEKEEVSILYVADLPMVHDQLIYNIVQLVTKALEQEKDTVSVTYED